MGYMLTAKSLSNEIEGIKVLLISPVPATEITSDRGDYGN